MWFGHGEDPGGDFSPVFFFNEKRVVGALRDFFWSGYIDKRVIET